MDRTILLPSAKDVLKFVNIAEQIQDTITVSKEECRYSVDGSSLLGMMTIIGARVVVHARSCSTSLSELLSCYAVQ